MNRSTLFGFLIAFITFYNQVFAQGIEVVGSCNMPDKAWAVQVLGEYAYVACDSSGLQVIDVSDPAHPIPVAVYNTPGVAVDIFISENYAYVADWSSLQIIDISNPNSPSFVGGYQANNVAGVFVSADQAYIACCYYPPVVAILDVSDPYNPNFISGLSFLGGAFDVFYSQNHLYILSNTTEPYANYMRVIDIGDPQNPYISGSVGIPGTIQIPQDIKINGDYAYIADRGSGIPVVNISDPSFPVVVGSYNAVGDATGIFIGGEYAYVSEYNGVIQALDISDPINPLFYASGSVNGPAFGIVATDDYIFAVGWYEFVIFQHLSSDIDEDNSQPVNVSTTQNYPNPFNARTSIQYSLSEPSDVIIAIYDILGSEVETLIQNGQSPGNHQLIWDANNFSTGIYFYRIQTGGYTEAKKMVLLK